MCAILQLVSAPLNPTPIAEHFRFTEERFVLLTHQKSFRRQLCHPHTALLR